MEKIDPNIAANIYKSATGGTSSGSSDGEGEGGSFMGMVRNAAVNSMEALRNSERVSAQAVAGEADITDVVQAVDAAEMTLQTIVSVRDRMVSAYQEIMRMPI